MPVVTSQALREQIARGMFSPVYLLVGDDDRLLDSLAAGIADSVEEELRAFNCERIYAGDKDVFPADVVEAARIAPLMSPRRVVTVLRAERWLKPKRAAAAEAEDEQEGPGESEPAPASKGAMAPLIEYLTRPVATTVLVLIASDVNGSTAAVKALYKSATVVECVGLADGDGRGGDTVRQATGIVREAAAAAGRQLEPSAALLLAERSGGDISRLRADLDHVLLFVEGQRAITRGDVEAVVSDRESASGPWAVVDAIEAGKPAEALRQLALALDGGAAPVMVLGQLAYYVREKMSRARAAAVPEAVQAVFRTDADLKSSGGDPRVLLERLVLELCGPPKRRRGF